MIEYCVVFCQSEFTELTLRLLALFFPKRRQPCTVTEVFHFCWVLFVHAKGKRFELD